MRVLWQGVNTKTSKHSNICFTKEKLVKEFLNNFNTKRYSSDSLLNQEFKSELWKLFQSFVPFFDTSLNRSVDCNSYKISDEKQWQIYLEIIICTTIVFISYFITYFTSVSKIFCKILSGLPNLKTTANHFSWDESLLFYFYTSFNVNPL